MPDARAVQTLPVSARPQPEKDAAELSADNPNASRGDDSDGGGVPRCPAEAEPPSTAACASMRGISETSWARP